jgi:hypothetical protein
MAIFSLSQLTTATANATPNAEIIAGTNNAYRMLEFGFTNVAATGGTFGLGTPAAIGVGPTSPVTVLAEDTGDTTGGATSSALAWGTTAPTVPAAFFRRISVAATIGVGTIWTFPRGIKILKAKTLVMWIAVGAASAVNFWYVVDE